MKTDKDYLEDTIEVLKPVLKDYGFKKSGLNWYSEGRNTIKIFNIQKTAFGKQVYLNIGIKVKQPGEKPSFTIPGCAVTTRLDGLIEKSVLDFEKPMNTSKRLETFRSLILNNPYGFFTLADDKEAILKFISVSKSENQITGKGRKYLGLPIP